MTLTIIGDKSQKEPITVSEFLALFTANRLDAVEQEVRVMREKFHAPARAADEKDFYRCLLRFQEHSWRCFYSLKPSTNLELKWSSFDRRYFQDVLGYSLDEAERNAVHNCNGGLIKVIDDITEGLVRRKLDWYIEQQCDEYVPRDHSLRIQIAQELLRRYGNLLIPANRTLMNDDRWFAAVMLEPTLEGVVKDFVLRMRPLRHYFES